MTALFFIANKCFVDNVNRNMLEHGIYFIKKQGVIAMVCPKCNSENVTTQIINEVHMKNQHHGIIWWMIVGWWWTPIKWIFFTVPALIFSIFGHKKQKAVNKKKTMCVCQQCGHTWEK